MPADTRLAVVLFGSFLLAFPALNAFLRGDLDASAVGMRFAGAAALAWVAITLVTSIVTGYRAEPVPAPVEATGQARRRADDPPAGPVPDPAAQAVDADPSAVSDASGG